LFFERSKMLKNYIINKLTQLSAWIGLFIIIAAFFLPSAWIALAGVLLILTDDDKLQKLISKWSPSIKSIFEKNLK